MNYDNIDTSDMIAKPSGFMKRRSNGLFLSDEDIEILDEYEIDYLKCKTLQELIFEIEDVINDSDDCIDLIDLNQKLGEYNYYNYTNK